MVKIKLNPEKVLALRLETARINLPVAKPTVYQSKLRGEKRYNVRVQLYQPHIAFERFKAMGKYEVIVFDMWEGRKVYHAWGNNRWHMLEKVTGYYKQTKCNITYGPNCEPED